MRMDLINTEFNSFLRKFKNEENDNSNTAYSNADTCDGNGGSG